MRSRIEAILHEAIEAARAAGELQVENIPDAGIERPREKEHGDWATSIAMRLAKQAKMNPRAIAEIISAHIPVGDFISSVEIAGPGFINMRLSNAALQGVLVDLRVADERVHPRLLEDPQSGRGGGGEDERDHGPQRSHRVRTAAAAS